MKGNIYSSAKSQSEAVDFASTKSQLKVLSDSITAGVSGVKTYVQSRGENLITNGNGLMGDNTNFTSFTFDATQSYAGGGSFYSNAQNATRLNDELIPVNPTNEYRFSLMAKTKTGLGKYYFMASCYDIDSLSISPFMTYGSTRPIVQLAADLKAGDTTITLTSVDGFIDNAFAESDGHKHSIVFWGYKNSKGYTYPDGTYSRLYRSAMWNNGGINRTTKVITLNKAWNYPNPYDPEGIWRTGQNVSATQSGGSYKYFAGSNIFIPTEWTKQEGTISGIGMNDNQFMPGTAYVLLGGLLNRSSGGGTAGDEIWLNSLEFYNTTSETKAKEYSDAQLKITKDAINLSVAKTTGGVRVRYIRDWLNGSNANANSHWVQVQAFKDGTNVAAGRPVTASGSASGSYPLTNVTNGNLSTGNYAAIDAAGVNWIQVDLGSVVADIDYLMVYHYFGDGRTYNGTKTEVSEDGVTWFPVYDSEASGKYQETSSGMKFYVNPNHALSSAESSIKVSANKIALVVKSDDTVDGKAIASSINQTSNDIQIQASKININGAVSFGSFDSTIKDIIASGESDLFNTNQNFIDYPTTPGVPTGYIADQGVLPTKVVSNNATGYSVQSTVAAGVETYFRQQITTQAYTEFITVSATFKLTSGTIDGAGIMFRVVKTGGNEDLKMSFKDANMPITLNKWYTITKTFRASSGTGFTRYDLYVMPGWSSFAPITAKTILLDSVYARGATEAEKNAYTAEGSVAGWRMPNKTTINGGTIETNTITANQIAANSITANKLILGDTTNYVTTTETDPKTAHSAFSGVTITGGYVKKTAASNQFFMLCDFTSTPFKQNDELFFSLKAKAAAATTVNMFVWYYDINKNNTSSEQIGSLALTTADKLFTGSAKLTNAQATTAPYILIGFDCLNVDMSVKEASVRKKNTADLIVDGTITASKLATGTITANEISGNTITANKIATGAITANEIAGNTITANKIATGTITANEIAGNTITAAKIATGTITANEIAGTTITAAKIATDTITAAQIAANAITVSELAANSVNASKIIAGSITANEISGNTITGAKMVANAITTREISANAVRAENMFIGDMTNMMQYDEASYPGPYTVITNTDNLKYFKIGQGAYATLQMARSERVEFKVGDSYYVNFSGFRETAITGNINFIVRYYYTDTSYTNAGTVVLNYPTVVSNIEGVLKITAAPTASKTVARVDFFLEKDATTTGYYHVRNLELRKMMSGKMIVDGTIDAGKVKISTSGSSNNVVIDQFGITATRGDQKVLMNSTDGFAIKNGTANMFTVDTNGVVTAENFVMNSGAVPGGAVNSGVIDAGRVTISGGGGSVLINGLGLTATKDGTSVVMNATDGFAIKNNGNATFSVSGDGTITANKMVLNEGSTISVGGGVVLNNAGLVATATVSGQTVTTSLNGSGGFSIKVGVYNRFSVDASGLIVANGIKVTDGYLDVSSVKTVSMKVESSVMAPKQVDGYLDVKYRFDPFKDSTLAPTTLLQISTTPTGSVTGFKELRLNVESDGYFAWEGSFLNQRVRTVDYQINATGNILIKTSGTNKKMYIDSPNLNFTPTGYLHQMTYGSISGYATQNAVGTNNESLMMLVPTDDESAGIQFFGRKDAIGIYDRKNSFTFIRYKIENENTLQLLSKGKTEGYTQDTDGTTVNWLTVDGTQEDKGIWVRIGGGSRTHIHSGETNINLETHLSFSADSESMVLESNKNMYFIWNTDSGVTTDSSKATMEANTNTIMLTENCMRPTVANKISLGLVGSKWSTVFANTTTINSDSRTKQEIKQISGADWATDSFSDALASEKVEGVNSKDLYKFMKQLPIYQFEYRDIDGPEKYQYGFIADQALANDPNNVAPLFVYQPEDPEHMIGVSTQSYAAAIHMTLQEEIERNDKLEKEVKSLRRLLTKIQKQLKEGA